MSLTIKLIEVKGEYKALVLDMSLPDNRIKHIASSYDKDEAWNEAQAYIEGLSYQGVTWH